MTKEEYQKELIKIQDETLRRKHVLAKEYALSHNAIKKGDIIKDHIGSIIVENISITKTLISPVPECKYYGLELTKQGLIYKSEKRRTVYQSNLL